MSRYLKLINPVGIFAFTGAGGPLEKEGPIGDMIDWTFQDDVMFEKSYEKAEQALYKCTINGVLEKAGISREQISFISGGDLLNQIITSNYCARDLQLPFIGLYGACSTFAQSLAVNSLILSSQSYGDYAISVTSSHFSTAERQYRYPLEFGNQRASTTQWTVTGAGAVILSSSPQDINITEVVLGQVVDFGIKDAANMGAAMAPSACDTIKNYFKSSNNNPEDFDYIITGDLGNHGSELLQMLLSKEGLDISSNHVDCGMVVYGDNKKRCCGGSGCGCSALVMCSRFLNELKDDKVSKVLLFATGALLSPTSIMQGESIPGITHGVCIEKNDLS